MFRSLLDLNIYQAFRYNPLIFILLILSLIYLMYYMYIKISKKELKKINKKTWYVLLIIVLLFTILRNTPLFDYLAPTTL